MATEKLFGDLYEYSGTDGKMTVIPDFPTVRQKVAEGFQRIFTSDFVTDPETPNGVLIDAISVLFFDTLGVVAQNANGMNIEISAGQLLDALGGIFGVQRMEGESDDSFRERILGAQARGSGTARSVRQALSANENVLNFCVLENGAGYPVALPKNSAAAIAVDAHSILVCVKMADDTKIQSVLDDVYDTKSLGCGCSSAMDIPEGHEVTDDETGITVYTTVDKEDLSISVSVRTASYTGSGIVESVENAIKEFVRSNSICSVLTKNGLVAAISKIGVVVDSVTYELDGLEVDEVVVRPYEYLDVDSTSISVELV